MNHFPDHPFVRESWECPICGGPKASGLVWCWPCHNETQTGPDAAREAAEDQLDAAEAQHVMDNGFGGLGA